MDFAGLGSKVIIVEERPNPSTDFFIQPALSSAGVKIQRCSFGDLLSADDLTGASVLFVRYVPRQWKKLLTRYRDRLAGIYFFMDDDLFDHKAFAGFPLWYQIKLFNYSWLRQRWLKSMGGQLLVSTPYLEEKYASWNPVRLAPHPGGAVEKRLQTVFYHGQSVTHMAEMRWLYPVIEAVLERSETLTFEFIGSAKVNRLFRGMPRVHVLHPMKWPEYQSLLRRSGYTIGLAPLLNSPFNKARSYTKFFDITQAGAVGIYADDPVFHPIVEHNLNGLMLPMEQGMWIESILDLAAAPSEQERLLATARQSLERAIQVNVQRSCNSETSGK